MTERDLRIKEQKQTATQLSRRDEFEKWDSRSLRRETSIRIFLFKISLCGNEISLVYRWWNVQRTVYGCFCMTEIGYCLWKFRSDGRKRKIHFRPGPRSVKTVSFPLVDRFETGIRRQYLASSVEAEATT